MHAIHPTICWFWGVTEAMPCPHSGLPTGRRLDHATVMRWMMTSLELGGHDDITCPSDCRLRPTPDARIRTLGSISA